MRDESLIHQVLYELPQYTSVRDPIDTRITSDQEINIPAVLLPAAVGAHDLNPEFRLNSDRFGSDEVVYRLAFGAGDAGIEIVVKLDTNLLASAEVVRV